MPETITTTNPSERTLDDIPEKVTKFLGAVQRNRNIRRILFSKGLTKDIRLKAWGLLKQVIGEVGDPGDPDPEEDEDREVAQLITELDQLDEGLHRVLSASLEFNHPAQFVYILGGLAPSTKMDAVLGLDHLTGRVEALRDNTDPKRQDPSTHTADLSALATLSLRGYDDTFWKVLRGKINRLLEDLEDPEAAPAPDATALERDKALVSLYQWHKEWSTIAREFIKRRDQLIALGLAKPKKKKEEVSAPTLPPPVTPDPTN